jgi:hypothetical protein
VQRINSFKVPLVSRVIYAPWMFKVRMDTGADPMRRGPRLEPITLPMRASIVLSGQRDRSNGEIAQQLRVTPQTVGRWRSRLTLKRLDGLLNEPWPGVLRTIDDEEVKQVIAKTLQEKPRVATQWSSRRMAKASGAPQTAVVRIWRAIRN